MWSVNFVLLGYLSSLKNRHWVAAGSLWASLWFRQTNFVWCCFIAGIAGVRVLKLGKNDPLIRNIRASCKSFSNWRPLHLMLICDSYHIPSVVDYYVRCGGSGTIPDDSYSVYPPPHRLFRCIHCLQQLHYRPRRRLSSCCFPTSSPTSLLRCRNSLFFLAALHLPPLFHPPLHHIMGASHRCCGDCDNTSYVGGSPLQHDSTSLPHRG